MKVLDSDFLIAILRGREEDKEITEKLETETIVITSINVFEIYFGIFKSKQVEENTKLVSSLVSVYDVIPFNTDAAKIAGRLYADLQKQGEDIGIRDVMIAAICLINNAVLITRNVQHYSRIKGLKVEEW